MGTTNFSLQICTAECTFPVCPRKSQNIHNHILHKAEQRRQLCALHYIYNHLKKTLFSGEPWIFLTHSARKCISYRRDIHGTILWKPSYFLWENWQDHLSLTVWSIQLTSKANSDCHFFIRSKPTVTASHIKYNTCDSDILSPHLSFSIAYLKIKFRKMCGTIYRRISPKEGDVKICLKMGLQFAELHFQTHFILNYWN